MNEGESMAYWLAFWVGAMYALFFPEKTSHAAVDAATPPKIEPWKTTVDPKIIGAVDRFGFNHRMHPAKDSTARPGEKTLFPMMAQIAINLAERHLEETGTTPLSVNVEAIIWTANRGVLVKTVFVMAPSAVNGPFAAIQPASEVERWQNLDRAMRCFLN